MNSSKTMSLKIAESLKNDIELEVLKPGDKLASERELVKKYQVSRSSIREAVKRLTTMGYIESLERKGNYISAKYLDNKYANTQLNNLLKTAPIFDLMEVRLFLEENFIVLAIQRATEEDFDKMKAVIERMKRSEDLSAFLLADMDFHLALAEATHNVVILELMKIIIKRVSDNEEYFLATGIITRSNTINSFERLVDNLINKNLDEAKRIHYEHLHLVKDTLDKSI